MVIEKEEQLFTPSDAEIKEIANEVGKIMINEFNKITNVTWESLINSAKPEYMVVALDTGKRTFRNDLYDQFVENKAIEEFFKNDECKKHFTNINLTLEDVKNKETSELIELTGVNHDKLINLCNEYNIEILKPPKILVLLLFFERVN